ncbi:unnamed protein product, partial [Ectocarpus sp. 4 AP-2014]
RPRVFAAVASLSVGHGLPVRNAQSPRDGQPGVLGASPQGFRPSCVQKRAGVRTHIRRHLRVHRRNPPALLPARWAR